MDIAIPLILFFLVTIALIVIVVLQAKRQAALTYRLECFMQGEEAASLEDQIGRLATDVTRLKRESKAYANDIDLLFAKHESAIQKVGLIKYDAFSEMGGKMSFCLALLDELNNGVVINSVHSTTACYSYTKKIREGNSDIALSPEEAAAIRKAVEAAGENA